MRKTNLKIEMLAGKNLNSCPDSDSNETFTLEIVMRFREKTKINFRKGAFIYFQIRRGRFSPFYLKIK